MATRAHYHPRDIDIDTGAHTPLPKWLFDEIASWHGQINPKEPPVFTCLGNGEPMYVWRHDSGRYFLRHYAHGNPNGHSHVIATMSDEHRRQADYTQRAAANHGLDAVLEKTTGNHTRLDVAVYGPHNTGFEIQRSELSRAQAKRRAWLSFNAGWPTAWITDRERDPDWVDHVGTARLTVRGYYWAEALPPPNSVHVSIGEFSRERDRQKKSGWAYKRSARAVLLDDLAYLMPAGEIIPVAVGTKGQVSLAFKAGGEIIDSCTYPGASVWRPTTATPKTKEAAQRFSRACRHEPLIFTDCLYCERPFENHAAQARGYCDECQLLPIDMRRRIFYHRIGA